MLVETVTGLTMADQVQLGFHVADYILFSVFLVISVGIGVYHAVTGGRQRTIGEYMVANRQMKMIPVAISMFVSVVSGVLLLGHPAEIYTRGGQFVVRAIGHVIAGFVAGALFVPLFFRLRITSAFEVSSISVPGRLSLLPLLGRKMCSSLTKSALSLVYYVNSKYYLNSCVLFNKLF